VSRSLMSRTRSFVELGRPKAWTLLRSAATVLTAVFLAAASVRAQAPTPDLLYVCIQDEAKIAVVDMATRQILRTIDLTKLGFSPTAKPHHIAVESDGAHWYVSLIGENRVLKLDREDRIVAQYQTEVPGMLSLSPDGDRLVVSRSMSAVNPPSRLAVLSTADMKGDEVGVFFPRPHPVVVAGNGYAYTGSLGVNQIASVELASGRVRLVPVPGASHSFVQFRISPDGKTLVASTDRSGQLLVFDLAVPDRPSLVTSVDVGMMAFDPVFTPDGRSVYVPVKSTNEVIVIDAATWRVTRRITHEALEQPHQIVFSADGRTAFVSNNNKSDHMADPAMAGHTMPATPGSRAALVVIDVAAGTVVQAIELGMNLTGMGTRAAR
jgi:YVTN family beta-propeller protein